MSTPPATDRGVYGISVAAELVGMGVQTLRLYESRGLLEPARTAGGTRRYSERDLDRLRRIGRLLADGLNLAGIALVLALETENSQLENQNSQLENQNSQLENQNSRLETRNARLETENSRLETRNATLREHHPARGPAASSPH
jgi:MerR family transcriptional regulator, heat shock protein HspR